MADISLSKRTLSGVSWTVVATIAIQVLNLSRSVALARLLSRDAFGIIGMAATVSGALAVLTNIGFDNSVIASTFKDDEELKSHLNTVWTVELGRRILLTLLLLAAVYPTAQFYGDKRLLTILPLLSLIPLIQGFNNVGLILLRREVKFAKLMCYEVSVNFLITFLSILCAWWMRSVWAIIVGQLIGTVIGVALSYVVYPYLPRFAFDRTAFDRGLNFGKYIFLIGIMVYITTTADNILVGKLLGSVVLGTYLVAYSVANLPQNLISKMFGGVLLSVYAELGRGDTDRLTGAVTRMLLIGSALITILTVPMILLAPEIIQLLYGTKWMAAATPLQILMIVGLFRGLIQLIGPLIMGLNKPQLEARSTFVEAAVFLIVLYPLTKQWGTCGAAWAGVIVYFTAFVCRFWLAQSLVPQAISRVPGIVLSAVLSGLGGGAVGFLVLSALPPQLILLRLFVGTISSIFVTGLLLLTMKRELRAEATQALERVQKLLFPQLRVSPGA